MITEADLHRFETALRSEPLGRTSMSPSMVDGMLTAAVIGPRPVSLGLLLPWVLDRQNGQPNPGIHVLDAQEILNGMVLLQNRIALDLRLNPPKVTPLFLINQGWSHVEWVDGFEVAMGFGIGHWETATKERTDLWGPIVSFGDPKLREIVGDDWPEVVASLCTSVIGFRDYFRGETREEFLAAHTPHVRKGPKLGRNDPCPCGSGRKHKKCCGASGEAVH